MSSAYHNNQAARQTIAATLSRLLADTYTLYLKTQGFHWNVVGAEVLRAAQAVRGAIWRARRRQ